MKNSQDFVTSKHATVIINSMMYEACLKPKPAIQFYYALPKIFSSNMLEKNTACQDRAQGRTQFAITSTFLSKFALLL